MTTQQTHDDETEEVIDPAAASWSAESLYRISSEQRRVLFLELLARAVLQAERAASTHGEWGRYSGKLRRVRARHWGVHPWPHVAKDSTRFHAAVDAIATTFAEAHPDKGRGIRYPGRSRQPLDR